MNRPVLIDTSAWVEALRRNGNQAVRNRIEQLLLQGVAAWCDVVRLELWRGVRGDSEEEKLRDMERSLIRLPIDRAVWETACQLAPTGRAAGLTVLTTDLIIFACAKVHDAAIEHVDRHFELMEDLYDDEDVELDDEDEESG